MTSNTTPHPTSARQAVIYCRVAAIRQRCEESDFQNQEGSCRAHAEAKGYDVHAVFSDYSSGKSRVAKRPGLKALMSYLMAHQNQVVVVITVDPTRLSQDFGSQVRLRRAIEELGATIEHPDRSSSAAVIDDLNYLVLDMYAEELQASIRRRKEAAKK